ncbi:MAG: hypothetical protein AB6733_22840 [Clostridiaceae bacterium]
MKSLTKKLLSAFLFVFLLTTTTSTAFAATNTYKANSIIIMDYNSGDFINAVRAGVSGYYGFVSDVSSAQTNINVTSYWVIQYGGKNVSASPAFTSRVTFNSYIAGASLKYNFPKKGTYVLRLYSKKAGSTDPYTCVAARNIVAY